jgi:hypothetical protein
MNYITTTCPRPCQETSHHSTPAILRRHLLSGARCIDAWLTLAEHVATQQQRLDCLVHAAVIDPADLNIQIDVLSCRLALAPQDQEIAAQLRQAKALQVVRTVRPHSLRRRDPARSLGTILLDIGAISDMQLHKLLNEQRRFRDQGAHVLLGELSIRYNMVPPSALARALMIQYHERQDYGSPPTMIGEILVHNGSINLYQLELAIAEQLRLLQLNQRDSIGKILLRYKIISWPTLQQAIQRQQQIAMAAYI